ncbi:MAG TPA: nucleoside-triphosphatase [Candidatus Saccharimonadales bacterium]|nr:nucleoside-triphosphatase [Candidatus Saccharimonadales bacterium]
MNHFVLAITGPTGAGKSTVGEKVAKSLPSCVNIDADHIKHMVVSGFYVNETSPEDPEGWGFSEWDLVGDSIGLLARNFLDHNYDVVINGYINEPAWHAIEKHIDIYCKILLLPDVDKVKLRDSGRVADIQMGEETVTKHHKHFSNDKFYKDFITLDTTEHSVEETVEAVLSTLGIHNVNK